MASGMGLNAGGRRDGEEVCRNAQWLQLCMGNSGWKSRHKRPVGKGEGYTTLNLAPERWTGVLPRSDSGGGRETKINTINKMLAPTLRLSAEFCSRPFPPPPFPCPMAQNVLFCGEGVNNTCSVFMFSKCGGCCQSV